MYKNGGEQMMIKKISAYKIYLLYSGITALLFSLVTTVMIVYHIENVHMNPLQLILVGTVLEAVCFIFEIPTGIVADVYSRKLSIIIGLILIGIGFTIEGSIPIFSAVIISQVVWGIGSTFTSGSVDAWIAEEENKNVDFNQIYLRAAQAGQIGSVIGIILATILGNFSVRIPILLSGVLFVVFALFLVLFMPENSFRPCAPEDINTYEKMVYTMKRSVGFIKSKPTISLLLLVTLFYGLSSEGYDRLSTAHFLRDTTLPKLWNLQPVTWFGIFGIAGMVLSAISMQFIIKRLRANSKIRSAVILLITNTLSIMSMAVFALTRDFSIMLIAYLSTNMFRSVNEPILNAWINRHIDDNARATILSTNGQINSLGQIIGGPFIGVLAANISVSFGIACTAILLTPVIVLYALSIKSDRMHS
jgi:DHA3 family tetracycline resistance protein-like MFS transporter